MRNWITRDETGLTLHIPAIPDGGWTVLWLAAFGLALVLSLTLLRVWQNRETRSRRLARSWRRFLKFLRSRYLLILLPLGFLAILWAAAAYLWRIPALIGDLLAAFQGAIADPTANSFAIRNLAYGFAALTGTLAILATVPFQLVRVWINERNARTAEENLTTDLINKAVEGLGAERTISRIGRPVTFRERVVDDPENPLRFTEIEWQGEEVAPLPDNLVRKEGNWQSFETTVPNIEVRLGAIYALERIAQDSDRDHVRIMEILCAYLRENAPGRDAKDHGLGDWPDYPDGMTAAERDARKQILRERANNLREWLERLAKPRTDIQAAIEVIGRRSALQIDLERDPRHRRGAEPYRLDLREVNLRRADLSRLNLEGALLSGARLERADFQRARLEGANLWTARLEGALLREARLEGAYLEKARLEGASLEQARLEGASLWNARLEGAFLTLARLEGADLRLARLEGAVLWQARLEEAVLWQARLEGAVLLEARLERADLTWARLEGADLKLARLEGAVLWKADLRAAQYLTQAQLEKVIGNAETLLPDHPAPDTGGPYRVWTCWTNPPDNLERFLERAEPSSEKRRAALRAEWICGLENPRRATGTPCALELTREECLDPAMNPLANRPN